MQEITTNILTVDPLSPERDVIVQAAELLRRGELVVFPTETVYGLGADALQSAALAGIFRAKGRPLNDPLIVHIASLSELATVTSGMPEVARRLAAAFWPGPLTLILPRGARVPSIVTAGLETVAVRMPAHPVARELIQALGSPIAAPSANRFMHTSPTTAQHVLADLRGRVSLILDGGPCVVGVESTIVDVSVAVPIVLRPGGIGLEALRAILPEVRAPLGHSVAETQAQKAPGQLVMHYAPSVPLLLFAGSDEAMRTAILAEVQRRSERGERVGVLVADSDLAAFSASAGLVRSLGSAERPASVAAALFASLRALEDSQVDVILCRSFALDDLGLAVRDRLERAAGGRVIQV